MRRQGARKLVVIVKAGRRVNRAYDAADTQSEVTETTYVPEKKSTFPVARSYIAPAIAMA
jgi:hypothetical protein